MEEYQAMSLKILNLKGMQCERADSFVVSSHHEAIPLKYTPFSSILYKFFSLYSQVRCISLSSCLSLSFFVIKLIIEQRT